MSRHYEDRMAELKEMTFRAQHDPEYLTRLRQSEGVSFSSEAECDSSSDTLDSSDSSSPDALRWEWCGGPPRPMNPPRPTPAHGTNRPWRIVEHLQRLVRRR